MSKRKYDHLRVRENEERRLIRAIKLYPSAPPEGDAMFGRNSPEVNAIMDEQLGRLELRRCTNGRCAIGWDPKQKQAIYSAGPAGCCDE